MKMYKVGGCVRDMLLGMEPKDIDYVVVGSSVEEMLAEGYELVGKDFPVFLKNDCEYALARTERKTGVGYNGFETKTENVSIEEDLFRRDLTINAMALSESGELIDPYGGERDLKNKILRHVSEHFSEDPVRVLRIARFSARYNFAIADATYTLMKDMVSNGEVDSLTPERIWKDVEKALTEPYLPNFFNTLSQVGAHAKIFAVAALDTSQLKESNSFEQNFCYVFSQVANINKWKMPEEYKTLVKHYKKYRDKVYSNFSPEEKLQYIRDTKARHSADYAQKLMTLCSDSSAPQLISDIGLLSAIDYEFIIAHSDKKAINKNIVEEQLKLLNQRKTKLKI